MWEVGLLPIRDVLPIGDVLPFGAALAGNVPCVMCHLRERGLRLGWRRETLRTSSAFPRLGASVMAGTI